MFIDLDWKSLDKLLHNFKGIILLIQTTNSKIKIVKFEYSIFIDLDCKQYNKNSKHQGHQQPME